MHKEKFDRKLFEGSPGDGEDELAAEKERWEKSFHAVDEGMFIIDRDFNILQANLAFAGLVGLSLEDIKGRKCYELVHGVETNPETCVTCIAPGLQRRGRLLRVRSEGLRRGLRPR